MLFSHLHLSPLVGREICRSKIHNMTYAKNLKQDRVIASMSHIQAGDELNSTLPPSRTSFYLS